MAHTSVCMYICVCGYIMNEYWGWGHTCKLIKIPTKLLTLEERSDILGVGLKEVFHFLVCICISKKIYPCIIV